MHYDGTKYYESRHYYINEFEKLRFDSFKDLKMKHSKTEETGALKGIPFPAPWLQRFSEIIPLSEVLLLARLNKTCLFHLTMNTVWKKKAKKLVEFQKDLSEYEQNVQIMHEGFWYEWYLERVPRTMPVSMTRRAYDSQSSLNLVGGIGMLFLSPTMILDDNTKLKIVVGPIVKPTAKKPGWFFICNTENDIKSIASTKKVKFKLITKYKVLIRTNGNFSININGFNPTTFGV